MYGHRRATITRSATEGSDSGRFYQPLHVTTLARRIVIAEQGGSDLIGVWPDEAEKLGVALIQAATEARRMVE